MSLVVAILYCCGLFFLKALLLGFLSRTPILGALEDFSGNYGGC